MTRFLLALTLLFPATAWGQPTLPPGLVSTEWVEANLERPDLVLLHVTPEAAGYDEAHLPGARIFLTDWFIGEGETGVGAEFPPLGQIEKALRGAGVGDASTVVVYGENPLYAARLWMTLDILGVGAAPPLFLDGGLQVWKEEGRPLTDEVPRVFPQSLTLRPDFGRLVDAEWILARLGHENVALVDARPDPEYDGTESGMNGGLRAGHIPGAKQLFWEELIESRERPRLRPHEELAERFAEAGAAWDDTVVTYCMVGLRASVAYMVARMLGYDTRFYDGSWRDWGSRADYPVMPRSGK